MAILGPFSVTFPVDFRSGGDTTKAAFGKHIQEIERIYGIINALDADKISGNDFTNKLAQHVNSTAPHPNLSLSSLGGNIDISRITGNLAASRVSGTLTNANINTGNVNGLNAFVQGLINQSIPSVGSFDCVATGDGGTYVHGYANFSTGCQIRFGRHPITDYGSDEANETTLRSHNFATRFTTHCSAMVLTLADNDNTVSGRKDWVAMVHTHGHSEFNYHIEHLQPDGASGSVANMEISYIAIGH